MKLSRSILTVLAIASLFGGCASHDTGVTAQSRHFLELPFEEPPGGWHFNVRRGDSRASVLSLCGRPDFAIGDDHWIYWDIHTPDKAAHVGGFDTMVMTFAENRVSNMRLVNGEALRGQLAAWVHRMRPSE